MSMLAVRSCLTLVAQYNISEEVRKFMQHRFPRRPTEEFAMERSRSRRTIRGSLRDTVSGIP